MLDVALSTMWGLGQFRGLADFFDTARGLGFSRFEFNHGVTPAMLNGLRLDDHNVTSIHEPCPASVSTSELKARNWLISALDEKSRRLGVEAVRRSIDLASEVGAQVVIVHPGRVDINATLEAELTAMYEQGKGKTEEYALARDRLVAARAFRAEANLAAVRRSLLELAEHATRKGVRLGLENRYHYHEIPLPNELEHLLSVASTETVGYWHDVGHAQALENLGLGSHQEWLRRFAHRMVGVHLHDIIGVRDHWAAGLGQMDWAMVARYLPAQLLRTCEFETRNSPQQVVDGVRVLIQSGCVPAPREDT